jgi:ketosteroid isomerase-like protein
MSLANVDIARRLIGAFNQDDVDAVMEFLTSDFEWFPVMPATVEGGSYLGREAVEAYIEDSREIWEEFHILAEQFRDLDDRALMLGRMEGRGSGSGVKVDTPYGMVFDFRGDKISRVRSYLDHDEALRAGGRSE